MASARGGCDEGVLVAAATAAEWLAWLTANRKMGGGGAGARLRYHDGSGKHLRKANRAHFSLADVHDYANDMASAGAPLPQAWPTYRL